MNLDQLMREATEDVVVDVVGLTRAARSEGRTIRRRRRVATASGVVAVAAVVALVPVAASLVAPDDDVRRPDASTASDTGAPAQPEEAAAPVPLDGRATAALLRVTVEEVADGGADAFAGQGGPGAASRDTYAELVLAPADRLGAGVVGVNVQDVAILDGEPRTCLGFMLDCTVTRLPGGDVLRIYRDAPDSPDGADVRRVAELLAPSRGVRVVVSATNGFDQGGNRWDVTRPQPVLTADQLRTVVLDERWAFEVPAEYAELGAALAPYDDLDAGLEETSPTASPGAG